MTREPDKRPDHSRDSVRTDVPDALGKAALGRVSQVIVDQVRLLIRQGQLKEGDRLPVERELCERFGVSRVTVREALRVLESSGLVQIRVGSRGGAFVTQPSNSRVRDGLADLLSVSSAGAVAVTEARRILEVGVVPLVCERATEADLDGLDELCRRAQQAFAAGRYSVEMSTEFHVAVAAATHNPAVVLLVQSFRDPVTRSLEYARRRAPRMGRLGTVEHAAFVAAVRARDVGAAADVMERHLLRTAGWVAS